MQRIIEFFKTTALGGLVLIVPLAVIAIAIGYLIKLLVDLNNAVAKYLPLTVFSHPSVIVVVAILTIVLSCFLAGLLLKTGLGTSLASKLDTALDKTFPMYGMIRNLTKRVTGAEIMEFTPAEVDLFGSDSRMLAFVIEKLPDERFAVFVPSSPTLTIGNIHILPATSIRFLDAPTRAAMDAITHWGTGTSELYNSSHAREHSPGENSDPEL